MPEMPEIEREGNGYRVRPRGPLPRSWLNAGTLTGISVAATALLATTLIGAAPISFLSNLGIAGFMASAGGVALSMGSVLTAAVAGNFFFQRAQDRAEREGVQIQDPGRINRGLFNGAMQGFGKAGWISLGATLVGMGGFALGWSALGPTLSAAIATCLGTVALPALAIGGVLAVTGALRGSSEYRSAVQQQMQNIENGIIYRESALARGQQPDLEIARSAALGNSLGVAANASPTVAAKVNGVAGAIGAGAALPSQEPQFTDYAYQGPAHAHPAFNRDPNFRFADQVRPRRAQVPAAAQTAAAPAPASPETQGFADRIEALRQQLASANVQARPN
jgi:hypothetical protein